MDGTKEVVKKRKNKKMAVNIITENIETTGGNILKEANILLKNKNNKKNKKKGTNDKRYLCLINDSENVSCVK